MIPSGMSTASSTATAPRKTQKRFLICLWGAVAVLLAVLIPLGVI